MNPARGFSMVEVLIAVLIITFGMLPIVNMYRNTTKKGGLSEFHIFFQARAVRISEFYSSYNYDYFKNSLLASGAPRVELPIAGKITDPALPLEYSRMLKASPDEHCWIQFEDNTDNDLVRLTVTIHWSFPLDDQVHGYTLCRLFARPDVTLSDKGTEYQPDAPPQ